MICTLCYSQAHPFCEDRQRAYYRCACCDLVFADPESRLSEDSEKKIYDFHENDPADEHYREFLSQLSVPLVEKLRPGMHGLDFGCGPGPTLSLMLEEQGMAMALYDIFYYPDKKVLRQTYDFVTATEVVEHFSQPGQSWPTLADAVRPGGWLGVMTWMFTQNSADNFQRWNYKGDPTHVSFYTPDTMVWLADGLNVELEIVSDRVILFHKPDT